MREPQKTRRNFLSDIAIGTGLLAGGCSRDTGSREAAGAAEVTLRIGPTLVDIAKDHTISTTGYDGSAPGPLIRLKEGVGVTVDLVNDTEAPELVHWHGQIIPAHVDGAEEEKSIVVP